MSMLHSVTTEREADTGEAGRATHDGRSAGQPKGAPSVSRQIKTSLLRQKPARPRCIQQAH